MSRGPGTDELGGCPRCGTRLGPGDVLISYSGPQDERHWADCPNCREIVHPVVSPDKETGC